MLKKIINTTFGAFLFTLPFKIQVVLFTTPLFLQGTFNPYTTLFLTLPDIIAIVLTILIGIDLATTGEKHETKTSWLPLVYLILFIGSGAATYVWAQSGTAVINNTIRLALGLLIPYLLLTSSYFKKNAHGLINIFIIAMIIQALIGITQFLMQHSVGFHLLGESHISPNTPGVAKIDLLNKKIIRSYGTFPHPNIFGGFLVMTTFLTATYIKERRRRFFIVLLLTVALILTFSRSAWLAGGLGLVMFVLLNRKKISWALLSTGVILTIVAMIAILPAFTQRLNIQEDSSLLERIQGIETSIKMSKKHPQGVGLGNFTIALQKFTQKKLAPWEYQPVHNTVLLAAAENGLHSLVILLGLMATLIAIAIITNKNGIVFALTLLVLMMFDHYFLTIPQGQNLFALMAMLSVYTTP